MTNDRLGGMFEVANPNLVRGQVRHALFDFDGTLSVIREGWQEIMIPFMVREVMKTGTREPESDIDAIVREFVTRLTGKQTVYQMIALADEIRKRGTEPLDPLAYKRMYLDLLWERIADRVAGLKDGSIEPDDMMVLGGRRFLEQLRERNVRLYLASGTDLPNVLDEAAALGIDGFFDGRIYGAIDDYKSMSKKIVIERILAENRLSGPELVVFGDGYVEIEEGKAVGGIAVAVPVDEPNRGGIDPWKRERLLRVGADIVIPHFLDGEALLDYLLPSEKI